MHDRRIAVNAGQSIDQHRQDQGRDGVPRHKHKEFVHDPAPLISGIYRAACEFRPPLSGSSASVQ